MRQLYTIPLLALYLLTSLGFHGVSHFCGDELVDVALYNSDTDDACADNACCSIPQPDEECCTELNFTLYFESERALTDVVNRVPLKMPHSVSKSNYCDTYLETSFALSRPDDQLDSDLHTTTPLYIRHQSLIFYG